MRTPLLATTMPWKSTEGSVTSTNTVSDCLPVQSGRVIHPGRFFCAFPATVKITKIVRLFPDLAPAATVADKMSEIDIDAVES